MSLQIPITAERLGEIEVGFALPSMGMAAQHTLEQKFKALQNNDYKFAILGFSGYMAWVRLRKPSLPASTCPPHYIRDDEPDPSDNEIWEALYASVKDVKELASSFGVKCLQLVYRPSLRCECMLKPYVFLFRIIVFQPISQYEGWHEGSHRSAWARKKAERWLKLCGLLGVRFLQVRLSRLYRGNPSVLKFCPYPCIHKRYASLAQTTSLGRERRSTRYSRTFFSLRTSASRTTSRFRWKTGHFLRIEATGKTVGDMSMLRYDSAPSNYAPSQADCIPTVKRIIPISVSVLIQRIWHCLSDTDGIQ